MFERSTASQFTTFSIMLPSVFTVVSLLLNLILLCDSGRILVVVPTPSMSHQVVFRPLTQELAIRGHDVVVLTTDPAFPKKQTPANLTEIDVHDISYKLWTHVTKCFGEEYGFNNNIYKIMAALFQVKRKIFEVQMNDTEFQKVIYHNIKFDLVIVEAFVGLALTLPYILKTPVIVMSSFGLFLGRHNVFGGPSHPILYPSPNRKRYYNLTIWEKITEMYNQFYSHYLFDKHELLDDQVVRRLFGSDIPPLSQLQNNVDIRFLNINPIFEGNYPVPPGVIHIWGIHKKPLKELPQDIKLYLDSSKHGVIYMSFGSIVDPSVLPPEKIQLFVEVFSKLPYDVLWKWNGDELPSKPENVRIRKWLPQSDLLRHPKVKLFITQGGLQSADEAITAKVPLVIVPMLGDQWYNAEKCVHLGIGIKLNWETITEKNIRDSIEIVIEDESYRKNIAKLSTLTSKEPISGLERAVWWTEYVMQHRGAGHLRAPAANISWAQYLELDLVLTLFLELLCLLSVCIAITYVISRHVSSNYGKNKGKAN